ncbi:flap endonuclease 1-like [Oppia nitens]|uniref:flap endonuclease 1-like n=1 Tax=Oppia nitens TaxID=1686743 RepID=UPI0023DB3A13|nr:flap endonuclease 1-like [Oppia nitens]
MGILNLSRLIADMAPESIREVELKSLFGRRVAIDASMSIYQFLIAIRNKEQLMTNDSGETTSHLIGLFYRTIKLLEMGIKPIYVFDGKAPLLKSGELTKRAERRKEAENKLAEAVEEQDLENITKFNKRVVRVTRQHNSDCKKLLQLMGLPVIEAPSEAEAQCAQLCKEGLVYATATEDMDGLTFGSPRLIRNLTSSNNEKVKEYYLDKVLAGLGLTRDQFIDLGILMGCDYCDSIKGVGGKKGLDLMKQYGSIEEILEKKFGITEFIDVDIDYGERKVIDEVVDSGIVVDDNDNQNNVTNNGDDFEIKSEEKDGKQNETNISDDGKQDHEENDEDVNVNQEENECSQELNDSDINNEFQSSDETNCEVKNKKNKSKDKKNPIPENWLFRGARKLFNEPNVLKGTINETDLKQKEFDEEALIQFLCVENGFAEDRVKNGLKRITESKAKSSQTRIDSFFKMIPTTNSTQKAKVETKNKRSAPQGKGTFKRGRR